MIQGQLRYEAQWIAKQYVDTDGEGNPDKDEYASSYHLNKEAAERAAIRASMKAGQCEWILVAEQKFEGYQWIDQRCWAGDWSGLVSETFNINEDSPC